MKKNYVPEILIFLFLIVLYSIGLIILTVQFTNPSKEWSTLIAGSMGFLGGAMGAMGAYFAAVFQVNKIRKNEIQNRRPGIIVEWIQGAKLDELNFPSDTKLIRPYSNCKYRFYGLKLLLVSRDTYLTSTRVKFKGKDGCVKEYSLGVFQHPILIDMKLNVNFHVEKNGNDSDIAFYKNELKYEYYNLEWLKLSGITSDGEKIKYELDWINKKEKFTFNQNESYTQKVIDGDWILPFIKR